MALVYRAHFALIRNPILTSKGVNTSALFGVTNLLLDLQRRQKPSHLAIAMDTSEPTFRHELFPAYKAQREALPEDIAKAIPQVQRLAEAFRIPVLRYPGHEADDVIGTMASRAEAKGLEVFMVTPDKDFAQLVTEKVRMMKPTRQGTGGEILGPKEVCEQWGVSHPGRVADVLALWGDASDNIPGVKGVGEKTSKKLIAEYGSLENLLANTDKLKGKQRENLEAQADEVRLFLELVTINKAVPVTETFKELEVEEPDADLLKALFKEFEFTTLGKRVFGEDFKSGRSGKRSVQGDMFADQAYEDAVDEEGGEAEEEDEPLKTIQDTQPKYTLVESPEARDQLIERLREAGAFCFDLETDSLAKSSRGLIGLAFSRKKGEGWFVPIRDPEQEVEELEPFRELFADESLTKVGHNLKFDLGQLLWRGFRVAGPLFDTMIAHHLLSPAHRNSMDYLAERYLGYCPIPITELIGAKGPDQITLREVPMEDLVRYAAEDADVTWQLHEILAPQLADSGQQSVFETIEMPLVPVLAGMETEGIAIDEKALEEIGNLLREKLTTLEARVHELAGESFNLNSPRQLGVILFDKLNLVERPKKTATGQYSTNEQILSQLAPHHEIVQALLNYREAAKLLSTYVDPLPAQRHPESSRVHTTYSQIGALTGRLASSGPNLQNIPIRTAQGREIRKAFVPRADGFELVAADYSQIELRVMAEMSGDPAMRAAFAEGQDIHAATAAGVYDVPLEEVQPEQRRKAKMVNFGIMYGLTPFGLSQRLAIKRTEAAEIIDAYFTRFAGVKRFMDRTIANCQRDGFTETLTGRRRLIRDINSRNRTVRNSAERIAINSPIQGTAADMIKLAMVQIERVLREGGFRTRMLLQVHDELVFDLCLDEAATVLPLIQDGMIDLPGLAFEVPIVVEVGQGENWLVAHS